MKVVTFPLNMKNFTGIFQQEEDGGYICWVKEIPGAMSRGNNLEEAQKNLLDAIKLMVEYEKGQ